MTGDQDRDVVLALSELGGRFETLSAILTDFVIEQRKQNGDHENRIRTLESVIHAIEKIGTLESRICVIENSLYTLTTGEARRSGIETAIRVGLGILGGLIGAAITLYAALRGGGG